MNQQYLRIHHTIFPRIMNSTEVQNPRHKLNVFSSVLACAKPDHMFQKLSYSICGLLSLSFVTITLPQTVRLFYVSLRPHIYCYACVTERYTETLHMKKMAALVVDSC